MYCPNCGKLVSETLKYCSGCGERLSKADEFDKYGTPGKMLDNVLTTVFLVVMFGLGILVGLVAVLLQNSIEPKFVMFISIAYLAAVFGICYQLLSQVPKLIDAKLHPRERETAPLTHGAPPVQLPPLSTNQLEQFREPASVVENTTKTLDEVRVARK